MLKCVVAALPVVELADAPEVDARSISAERHAKVVALLEARDGLRDYITYLVRMLEEQHSMKYDEIDVPHPEWSVRLENVLSSLPPGKAHAVGIMDACALDTMAKAIMIRSNHYISTIREKWTVDMEAVTMRAIVDSMVRRQTEEEVLAEVPPPPIVKALLNNPGYETLATTCGALDAMAQAAKPLHGVQVINVAIVKAASDAARVGNRCVSRSPN
jgi:hypothetical protein